MSLGKRYLLKDTGEFNRTVVDNPVENPSLRNLIMAVSLTAMINKTTSHFKYLKGYRYKSVSYNFFYKY